MKIQNVDYEPDNTKVTLQGIVTQKSREAIIQDDTGGIALYRKAGGDYFKIGDMVQVTGILKNSGKTTKLSDYTVKKIQSDISLPEPAIISINSIYENPKKKYINKLIKINNVAVIQAYSSKKAVVSDESGNEIEICKLPKQLKLSQGEQVNVSGVLIFNKKFRLLLNNPFGLEKITLPEISNLMPPNMTSTFNTSPEISAVITCNSVLLDFSKTKLYVDGEDVPCIKTDNLIHYIQPSELSFGEHTVKIVIRDIYDNVYQKEWFFVIQKKHVEYNFYYGIPHAHTCYSDGKGRPLDAFEYAKKKGLHFLFVSDHSNFLDGASHSNYEYDSASKQYMEKEGSQWHSTRKEAEFINSKYDSFSALRGFEMRWYFGGHINIINSPNYLNGKKQLLNPRELSKWMISQGEIVSAINHPGRSFRMKQYIPEMDKLLNLIEVGNGAYPRPYIRTEDCYYRMLDMGWHLGAINGQDNHLDNWGDGDNLTVILAESLGTEELISAMKNRRTYSTETRTLKLKYKINNYWMGSVIHAARGDMLHFEISAEDEDNRIDKLQIITNGGKQVFEKTFGGEACIEWNFDLYVQAENPWYVVKVIHSNNKYGISSPVFVNTVW